MENEIKYHRKKPIKEFDINQTMYSLITNESKDYMNYPAVGFMENEISYKELISEADLFASALKSIGVKENSNVAILSISMPIVQETLLAISKLGASISFIDLRCKAKDIINYINNSDCKTVIVFEDILPLVSTIINETNVQKVIVCSAKDYLSLAGKMFVTFKDRKDNKKIVIPDDPRFIRFSDFISKYGRSEEVIPINFEKDRPSLIVQSSGSSGKPKQIVHTEYNFNSAVQKMAYVDLPFYRGNTMHVSVPPFIIYGLGNSVYASMAFTMKAEMNPFINEGIVYDDLGKFDISLATPGHYRYIYKKIIELNKDIDMLSKDSSISSKKELKKKMKELKRVLDGINRAKVFVSGGDKILEEEIIDMQQAFDTTIVNGYGNNECLGAVIVNSMYANKPGSIGLPMKDVDIKVVDPDTLEELPVGSTGEIYISSDNLFVQYLNNQEATDKIKEKDSNNKEWVKSGDLGYIDKDGYVFIRGRNRRVINKAAFKISPDSIEEVINKLPFVESTIVVGVPDEKNGSTLMSFVVLKEGINFEDVKDTIKNICEEELPDYEIPTYFEKLDKIPYTPNQKLDFRLLEDMGKELVNNKYSLKLVNKIN